MSDNNTDLERERTKNYELGHISQLKDTADDLRERAGEAWAEASCRREIELARQMKDLASELEAEADERRGRWKEEYE